MKKWSSEIPESFYHKSINNLDKIFEYKKKKEWLCYNQRESGSFSLGISIFSLERQCRRSVQTQHDNNSTEKENELEEDILTLSILKEVLKKL